MNTYRFDDIDLEEGCHEHEHASAITARQCWRDAKVDQLRQDLADARGEAAACSDNDCSCKRVVGEVAEELGYFEALAAL